ncbi:hypothetical protein HPP92_019770 [Vanilla planifolia]|uniref:MYB-CC type transcription factor LHEQLE-containing domain-containing protein n=1 Tax=Vanilla planifolia TaxID=51239 RepID=A0A835Q003_VANPL|nr:hypothetical protein HPP92_019770 [Vanilla planifolia]
MQVSHYLQAAIFTCADVSFRTIQLNDALMMQIEVQRQLSEQLEVQRHLQFRIEAQRKYLQSVLEKAEETLGKQNFSSIGLVSAKIQLSELASSSEDIRNEHDMQNFTMELRTTENKPFLPNEQSFGIMMNEDTPSQGLVKKNNHRLASSPLKQEDATNLGIEGDPRSPLKISTSHGLQASRDILEAGRKKAEMETPHIELPNVNFSALLKDRGEQSIDEIGIQTTQLDLNIHGDEDDSTACMQFDLDDFA